jgi:multidrug resistance protein, MATE family
MTSNKEILKITYPILLTLIAQNVVSITNTAFLGRVGEVELGASALGGVFYFAVYMVGLGFSIGAQILIGRRNGEQNYSQIGPIFNNGMIVSLLFGALVLGLSIPGVPYLMKYFVHSPRIYDSAVAYLDWRVYGIVFTYAGVMFRSFFVGITHTKVLTYSAFITAIVNVLFDYLLIFGNWGFPRLGISGAGISSVIAEAVSTMYFMWYLYYKTDVKQYRLLEIKGLDWKLIGQMLDLSVFIMLQFLTAISTWFLFFIFIEGMGERALAISNIGRGLYMLLMIPASALATAVNTIVSNLIGADRKDEVLPLINKVGFYSILIVLPLCIITFIFPEPFISLFTNNQALVAQSITVMRVISVANVLFSFCFVVMNGVSGTGNTRTAFLFDAITLSFYMAYVYYTTHMIRTTVDVVWYAEYVYWIIMGALGYAYLYWGNWRKKEI